VLLAAFQFVDVVGIVREAGLLGKEAAQRREADGDEFGVEIGHRGRHAGEEGHGAVVAGRGGLVGGVHIVVVGGVDVEMPHAAQGALDGLDRVSQHGWPLGQVPPEAAERLHFGG